MLEGERGRERKRERRDGKNRPHSLVTGSTKLLCSKILCKNERCFQARDYIYNWQSRDRPRFSPEQWTKNETARRQRLSPEQADRILSTLYPSCYYLYLFVERLKRMIDNTCVVTKRSSKSMKMNRSAGSSDLNVIRAQSKMTLDRQLIRL